MSVTCSVKDREFLVGKTSVGFFIIVLLFSSVLFTLFVYLFNRQSVCLFFG